MRFTKMHGAGNDFIIIDAMKENIPEKDFSALAAFLCSRRTSVGADGVMYIVPASNGGDFGMRYYNSDGSLGEMCGNGARCISRYGYERGLAGDNQKIETTAGLVNAERIDEDLYRVRLNDPSVIDLHRKLSISGKEYDCAYTELGDPGIPHCVLIYPEWDNTDVTELCKLGSLLRHAPVFPRGANVDFVKIENENEVTAVTYERGVEDLTLACGTGCGSIAALLSLMGLVSPKDLKIKMPGGTLSVSLDIRENYVNNIMLTGPAAVVYEGELSDCSDFTGTSVAVSSSSSGS